MSTNNNTTTTTTTSTTTTTATSTTLSAVNNMTGLNGIIRRADIDTNEINYEYEDGIPHDERFRGFVNQGKREKQRKKERN
ncbi:hypothetical protein DFA_00759 [Cavenderia fasciculata]|uniref:Uncharacterized protein n=1 Tax=Cavenderia fasciculata TaxID=261658 RepID=F4PTL2_CACFS|nr:uncharacterized protein DFA_00759 [Cavenderia fasciculata]EGG20894.1 hypothetical protein DFA_00759 [Cavenderia fasciculata]|eukprot:XP_004358744.1 hypothetical protein DFA_00759 [Cavenderia fasciculata]